MIDLVHDNSKETGELVHLQNAVALKKMSCLKTSKFQLSGQLNLSGLSLFLGKAQWLVDKTEPIEAEDGLKY